MGSVAPLLHATLAAAVVVILNANYAEAKCRELKRDVRVKGGLGNGSSRRLHHTNDDESTDIDTAQMEGSEEGPGAPSETDSQEEHLREDERLRHRARSREPPPLVCFVRGEGFKQYGTMNFVVNSVPIEKCTHVVYSYLETDNTTGKFIFRKKGLINDRVVLKKMALLKKINPTLKVLFSYGGGAQINSLLKRLRTEEDVDNLVETIDALIRSNDLDGVNFHLEGPGPSVCSKRGAYMVLNFIKRLRLKEIYSDFLLTVQMPACRDPKCDWIPKRELARYVDYIFLMTFDYNLDDLSKTKLTSAIKFGDQKCCAPSDTESCLQRWIFAGIPKSSIVPGIPTYGRSFTLDNPAHNGIGSKLERYHPLGYGGNFTRTDGYMNYVETCRRFNYYHWKRKWVKEAGMAYITYQDQWISYDDKESADAKVRWFLSKGLAGVFIWSVDQDDYSGDCVGDVFPMVDTAWKALQGYRPYKGSPHTREEIHPSTTETSGRAGEGETTEGTSSEEAERNARAPVVCFIRGEGFQRRGASRFSLRSLPLDKCTHFVYSYLETDNKTGQFLFRKRGTKGEKNILDEMGNLRLTTGKNHLRNLVSYGGGAHVQSLLNRIRDDRKAEDLINEIKFWLSELGIDGINFHLEGPGPPVCKPAEIETILNFIKKLRKALLKETLITLQLPACRNLECNGFMNGWMARHFDYLFLMTFDYKLDDLSKTKLTSGLYYYEGDNRTAVESESCLGRWINAGVPKYKIIPGIATYGRSFTLEDPAYNGVSARLYEDHPLGYGANFTQTDGYMNYVETCRRVNYYHWKREWVKYAATPYIYYEDQWVSYDDKDSVDVKATWFRKHWLGGIFVWSLDADDYSGECIGEIYPMVTAAWKPMRHYRPIPMRRSEDETPNHNSEGHHYNLQHNFGRV
ncbi:putative chitinase 10 [Amblyomma americanum]